MADVHRHMDSFVYPTADVPARTRRRTDAEKRQKNLTQDREALLQLYNALNGTDYQDASQLKMVVVENAVYVVMKNDLAFILAGTLNLYEHQSTYNPNMPVRFLIYLVQEYQRLVNEAESSIYGSRRYNIV